MNTTIKAVLFDVDGVLVDSFEANRKFFSDVLEKFGYPALDETAYKSLFHKSAKDVIKESTGTSGDEFEKIYQYTISPDAPYDTHSMHTPARAEEIIQELSKIYKVGIVTSRNRSWVFDGPESLKKLEKYFEVIVALEDVKKPKPDPEGLVVAAQKLHVSPGECLYIGDTENDMAAALNAGMGFIHFSMEPHPDAHAHASDFEKLPQIIAAL